MKKILLIIMIVFSAFVMAIPAGAAANPGFDDKEIRIAQFGPQTGPAAPWGAVALCWLKL
jgi:hypothetical protein